MGSSKHYAPNGINLGILDGVAGTTGSRYTDCVLNWGSNGAAVGGALGLIPFTSWLAVPGIIYGGLLGSAAGALACAAGKDAPLFEPFDSHQSNQNMPIAPKSGRHLGFDKDTLGDISGRMM